MSNKTVLYLIVIFTVLAGLLLLGAGLGNSIAINNLSHPHQAVGCRGCHGFESTIVGDSSRAERPRSTAQCLGCHTNTLSSDKTLSLFHELGDDCTDCHGFHQPKRLTINGDTTTVALVRSLSQLCADCHTSTNLPEVSPGHREAARLLHGSDFSGSYTNNPSEFCLACHDATLSMPEISAGFAPVLLHMSASHPYGIKLTPGFRFSGSNIKIQDEIDPSIRSLDGNMTCISCHSLTSENKHLLVASTVDGLCIRCHDMQRSAAPPVFTQDE